VRCGYTTLPVAANETPRSPRFFLLAHGTRGRAVRIVVKTSASNITAYDLLKVPQHRCEYPVRNRHLIRVKASLLYRGVHRPNLTWACWLISWRAEILCISGDHAKPVLQANKSNVYLALQSVGKAEEKKKNQVLCTGGRDHLLPVTTTSESLLHAMFETRGISES
jgi:hypothetical protein